MIHIDKAFLERVLGPATVIPSDRAYRTLGLVDSVSPDTLTFLDSVDFLEPAISNPALTGVFCNPELVDGLRQRLDLEAIVVDDPRYWFYVLQNECAKRALASLSPTEIDSTSVIDPSAHVAGRGVTVGANCIIEPKVVLLEGTHVGANTIIRAGTVVGAEGFEHKRTTKGMLSVRHDGIVKIGDRVEIGALNAISKGFSYRPTLIGDDTRTDNLVHIAHGVQIGRRCLLPAACLIAGSVTIGDDAWIGPGSVISSQVTLGARAFVTIGAVVTKDVECGARVTGNFAIPHDQFMRHLKGLAQ